MTQEKLEQRAGIFWRGWKGPRDMNAMFAAFARAELQKAAEIAQSQDEINCSECHGCGTMIAAKIRKLME